MDPVSVAVLACATGYLVWHLYKRLRAERFEAGPRHPKGVRIDVRRKSVKGDLHDYVYTAKAETLSQLPTLTLHDGALHGPLETASLVAFGPVARALRELPGKVRLRPDGYVEVTITRPASFLARPDDVTPLADLVRGLEKAADLAPLERLVRTAASSAAEPIRLEALRLLWEHAPDSTEVRDAAKGCLHLVGPDLALLAARILDDEGANAALIQQLQRTMPSALRSAIWTFLGERLDDRAVSDLLRGSLASSWVDVVPPMLDLLRERVEPELRDRLAAIVLSADEVEAKMKRAVLAWEVPSKPDPRFVEAVLTLIDHRNASLAFGAFDWLLQNVHGADRLMAIRRAFRQRGLRPKAYAVIIEEELGELVPFVAAEIASEQLSEPDMLRFIDFAEAMADSSVEGVLLGWLTEEEPVAVRVATLLADVATAHSIKPLNQALETGSARFREKVKDALAAVHRRMSEVELRLEKLIGLGGGGRDEIRAMAADGGVELGIRRRAIEHLARGARDGQHAPFLAFCDRLLDAHDAASHDLVIAGLRALGHPDGVRLLRNGLGRAPAWRRAEIAGALGEIGGDEAEQGLIWLLDGEPDDVVLAAIEALGHCGGGAALRALDRVDGLLNLGAVRTAARDAMQAIRDRYHTGGLSVPQAEPSGQLSVAGQGGGVSMAEVATIESVAVENEEV